MYFILNHHSFVDFKRISLAKKFMNSTGANIDPFQVRNAAI
jgi:hypothetical protein